MENYYILLLLAFASCKSELQDSDNIFITKTGKTILVEEKHPKGASLATIEIKANDFANGNHFILKDVDPIAKTASGDLDNNGFEEIYIITKAVGSGSYGNVFGYGSNKDKSMSPIYIPNINKKDLEVGGLFEGYMGHDTFTFQKDALIRQFPIYKEADSNSNPTGTTNSITYILKKGEASWQLKPIRTYHSEVFLVKNCSGTYIRFKGLDYKVCNKELLEGFKNETKVHITFKDSKPCQIPKGVAICAMYHPFVDCVEVISITRN